MKVNPVFLVLLAGGLWLLIAMWTMPRLPLPRSERARIVFLMLAVVLVVGSTIVLLAQVRGWP